MGYVEPLVTSNKHVCLSDNDPPTATAVTDISSVATRRNWCSYYTKHGMSIKTLTEEELKS